LKILLEEDEFGRWEALLLQRTLDALVDVVYCPRYQTVCLEEPGDETVCSSCLFSFCTLCREPRHIGVECISPEEKLHILVVRGLYLSLLHCVLLYPNFTRFFLLLLGYLPRGLSGLS
jgi:E3 ubiquitin-protein ligase RNF14